MVEREKGAVEGEHGDFRAVFDAHYPFLFNLALRTTGDREISDEVAQDVMIRLYRLGIAGELGDNLRSWLARVCLNASYDRIRAEGRRKHYTAKISTESDAGLNIEGAAGQSAEQEVISDETRRVVAAILSRLSDRDRGLLLLKHSGLSYQEISAALNIRVTSIGKLLSRAQSRFERLYFAEEGGSR